MGDKAASETEKSPPKPVEFPGLQPVKGPGQKPVEAAGSAPAEVPGMQSAADASALGDFARALTFTKQAFQLQQSVIESDKSVIINYPGGKGQATILKDQDGPAKVFRDGQVLLERLSKPASNGECQWLVMNNQEVRATFSCDKSGVMTFSLTNGDVYTFDANGDKKITKAQKPAQEEPPKPNKRELSSAQDLHEWMKNGVPLLDTNNDKALDFAELKASLRRKDLGATDAAFIASLVMTFDHVDAQTKMDGKVTNNDATALITATFNPIRRAEIAEINKAFARTFMRMKDKNDNLWGDFKDPKDAIKCDAVGQGAIGDCWLMGSIAALADTAPELIQRMIKDNSNGTYTVTFPGQADTPYTVEAPTNLEMALFARGSKYGTWVPILEKAAAKAFEATKFYNKTDIDVSILHGGTAEEAFVLLTGLTPVSLEAKAANMHSVLSAATQWNLPIAAGSFREKTYTESDENGVYGTHLYTLKYDPIAREIIVRNPWGWTPKSEPNNPDGSPVDGVHDGAFRLTLKDFQKSFRTVTTVVP